jgi:16S rRNA (cytosine967-C5)-methyltransferase
VAIAGTEHGIRLADNIALEQNPLWQNGQIEVQDAGSQMITAACAVAPGMIVVDLCAGAGGKTLALAADMQGKGRLIACDTDRGRLSRLVPRAARAGAEGETLLLNPGQEATQLAALENTADLVLIDAPCSGSGTWRRNPEARWRVTPRSLDQVTALQLHVLSLGQALVRPGGALVFAVCSLIDGEGRDQIEAFLQEHPGWQAERLALTAGRAHGPGWRLSPAHDGCDGFFIARLKKPC